MIRATHLLLSTSVSLALLACGTEEYGEEVTTEVESEPWCIGVVPHQVLLAEVGPSVYEGTIRFVTGRAQSVLISRIQRIGTGDAALDWEGGVIEGAVLDPGKVYPVTLRLSSPRSGVDFPGFAITAVCGSEVVRIGVSSFPPPQNVSP